MADLKLSFHISPYDRVLPLITGEVKPDGITLDYMGTGAHKGRGETPGSWLFYDQIKFQRYVLSEMSMSSFLRMRFIGWPYRALPVFHNRNFSYTMTWIRKSAEAGDVDAMRVLGMIYQNGIGVAADQAEAVKWFKKAASLGDKAAIERLNALPKER